MKKRWLALVLAGLMTISIIPVNAMADEGTSEATMPVQTEESTELPAESLPELAAEEPVEEVVPEVPADQAVSETEEGESSQGDKDQGSTDAASSGTSSTTGNNPTAAAPPTENIVDGTATHDYVSDMAFFDDEADLTSKVTAFDFRKEIARYDLRLDLTDKTTWRLTPASQDLYYEVLLGDKVITTIRPVASELGWIEVLSKELREALSDKLVNVITIRIGHLAENGTGFADGDSYIINLSLTDQAQSEAKVNEAVAGSSEAESDSEAAVDQSASPVEEELNAISESALNQIYQESGSALSNAAKSSTPIVGSIGGEWMMLGLQRGGQDIDPATLQGYLDNVIKTVVDAGGVLHKKKYTEYSRVVLALTALGQDVTDVGGYNLLEPLADYDKTIWQGINGAIFALIAFDSHNYVIPTAPAGVKQTTRSNLIQCILDRQLADGGWTLSGNASDVDMTAMAMQSLAPYYNKDAAVKEAVDKGLVRLSNLQQSDGGFGSYGTINSESCSRVIVALTALGIDPYTDSRFIKNGNSLFDALARFAVAGGGFKHVVDGSKDGMASEQAHYALAAYYRFKEGKTSLYDMSDVKIDNKHVNPDDPDDPSHVDPVDPTKPDNPSGGGEDKPVVKPVPGGSTIGGGTLSLGGKGGTIGKNDGKDDKKGDKKDDKKGLYDDDDDDEVVLDDQGHVIESESGKVIQRIKNLVLPKDPDAYTEQDAIAITKIFKKYAALSFEDKHTVEADKVYGEFEKMLDNVGAFNHKDGDALAEGQDLPWYLKLGYMPGIIDEDNEALVKGVLGQDGIVLNAQDIYFVNTLTGEEQEPGCAISIRLKGVNAGDYDDVVLIHVRDNGKIELIPCRVEEDGVVFESAEFSMFYTAAVSSQMQTILASSNNFAWILFVIMGLAAAGALVVIVLMRKQRR
ncbi:MAG: hypothetical protein KBS83_00290 [Lachnospiraceae bacterium]|nr:hypothetical protein [Candidatus Equihabitans merdae]